MKQQPRDATGSNCAPRGPAAGGWNCDPPRVAATHSLQRKYELSLAPQIRLLF